MAQYKVVELSFIGNRLVQPGEVVDVDFADDSVGPGENLEPVGDAPRGRRKSAKSVELVSE